MKPSVSLAHAKRRLKSCHPEVLSLRCLELGMAERSVNKSQIVFGSPHTFGWLRCAHLDANGLEGWERPDGSRVRLRRGAKLARIKGARGQPIVVRPHIRSG